ncbi:MAG: hypothetical protein R3B70_19355 [Polyangiaceae bacterium]
MKKSRRWLAFPLLAVAAYFGVRSLGGDSGADRDEPPGLLFRRVWLENIPESPTDYTHGLYVIETPSAGAFQRASAYDYHVEIFRHDQSGNKLTLSFPQTDKSAKVTFTIKRCDDLPPFDLCLTLSDNPWGGPKKYHGFFESEDESKTLPGAREALIARTGGQLR